MKHGVVTAAQVAAKGYDLRPSSYLESDRARLLAILRERYPDHAVRVTPRADGTYTVTLARTLRVTRDGVEVT